MTPGASPRMRRRRSLTLRSACSSACARRASPRHRTQPGHRRARVAGEAPGLGDRQADGARRGGRRGTAGRRELHVPHLDPRGADVSPRRRVARARRSNTSVEVMPLYNIMVAGYASKAMWTKVASCSTRWARMTSGLTSGRTAPARGDEERARARARLHAACCGSGCRASRSPFCIGRSRDASA